MNFFNSKDQKMNFFKLTGKHVNKENKEQTQEESIEKKKETKKNTPSYEQLMDERQQIKSKIQKTLEGIGLMPDEVNEVLNIVDETEKRIEFLKNQLIGSNIDQDPTEIQKLVFGLIKENREEMTVKMKLKVDEIIAKRNKRNK